MGTYLNALEHGVFSSCLFVRVMLQHLLLVYAIGFEIFILCKLEMGSKMFNLSQENSMF